MGDSITRVSDGRRSSGSPGDGRAATLPGATFSTLALWIIAIVAGAFFLRAASQLFIPITLGVLVSYALEPIVAWLARHHVHRTVATSALLLLILVLSSWGVYGLRDDVIEATEALPKAAARAREILTSQTSSGPAANIQQAASELQAAADGKQEGAGPASPRQTGERDPGREATGGTRAESVASRQDVGADGSMVGLLQQGVSTIFALAGHLLVIFFLVFFLLVSGGHVRERLVEVAGPSLERRRITARIIDDINAQVQRFLLVRLVTAGAVALATWGALAWIGVPQAAVWGILAGIFNSIPYFGPVIVSGGLLIVGLIQGGGLADAVKMSGAALVITSLEGWLLTPPLMGKAQRMSALVVFGGLLVWTWIWGAWGTILAVPMLVVVKAVADHVESLRPVSRLMAP